MVNVGDFLTTTLLIILHVVLLVIAIRVYLATRTRAAGLLLSAAIAYTLARLAWFSYDSVVHLASLPLPKSKSPALGQWSFYSIRFFHTAFIFLMILGLLTLRRSASNHPTNR
jgi:hypothetical protein